MELILTALKISLICTAVFAVFWRGMLLYSFGKWIESKVKNKTILKPIFKCLICQSSAWTLILWAVYFRFDYMLLPLIILIVAGMNTMITAIISNIIPDEEDC